MKKQILGLAIGVSALLLVSGCGSSEKKSSGSGTKEVKNIEVVAKGFQHDFWKSVNAGAKKAAKENDVTINFV
jgi:ribose transport system substrate-binding protein